jgi:hypothetical protein
MPQLCQIEIDFDIYKLIEMERRGFDEPPRSALRRLLKLPPAAKESSNGQPPRPTGRAWEEDGVKLPHGTRVRMEYGRGKQIYEGTINDGKWVINGRTFESPSGAASELAVTKKGKSTKLNGWNYWTVQLPGETEWILLNDLRLRARPTPLTDVEL